MVTPRAGSVRAFTTARRAAVELAIAPHSLDYYFARENLHTDMLPFTKLEGVNACVRHGESGGNLAALAALTLCGAHN